MSSDTKLPPNTELFFSDFENDDVRGFVMETDPHKYAIVINTRFSDIEQAETLLHEIYHIEHGHFDSVASGEKSELEIETETINALKNNK